MVKENKLSTKYFHAPTRPQVFVAGDICTVSIDPITIKYKDTKWPYYLYHGKEVLVDVRRDSEGEMIETGPDEEGLVDVRLPFPYFIPGDYLPLTKEQQSRINKQAEEEAATAFLICGDEGVAKTVYMNAVIEIGMQEENQSALRPHYTLPMMFSMLRVVKYSDRKVRTAVDEAMVVKS